MRNRLILVVTAFVLAFTVMIAPASAAGMDDIIFELKTFGIMQGDEEGDFQLDKPVTRAEFAAIVTRMMGMENVAKSYEGQQGFTDVSIDYWANGYIMMLSNMGIISGMGDGTFQPNEYLSYENICKMLVSSLGYGVQAEKAGGYPLGYTKKANDLGLLKNVNSVYPFTRQYTAVMVYNALYVKLMVEEQGANGVNYVVSDTTFRDKFSTGTQPDGSVEKREGLVTATIDAYINRATANMSDNQVEIDNVLYYVDDPNVNKYIGQRVTYYVNTENYNRIISIRPTTYNEITTISTNDIARVTDTQLTYYFNKISQKTLRFSSGVSFLKNNRPVSRWTADDIASLPKGELTLINNNTDEDSTIDVIMFKEYKSCVVESVNENQSMIYFIDGTLLNGKKYIDLDPDRNSDKRVVLYNADGTEASVSDVAESALISICTSEDGTYTEGIISNTVEEGRIQSADKDTIRINDTEYETENENVIDNIFLDRDVTVFINFKNEAAFVKKSSTSSSYGGIVSIYADETGSAYSVKMVLPSKMQELKEEIENESGGEPTIVSKLVCKNQEILNIALDDKFTYYGTDNNGNPINMNGLRAVNYLETALSSSDCVVVKYTINTDGKISRLEIPELIARGETKQYNSYERTFGKKMGAFGVDFETNTICIPSTPEGSSNYKPTTDDYLVSVEMNNGKEYTVQGFDKSDTRYTADLIVVKMPMSADSLGMINTKSKVGFVNEVINVTNEDGEETVKIKMLTQGGVKDFDVADNFRMSDKYIIPGRGDLIVYSEDENYDINAIKVVKSFNGYLGVGGPGVAGDYEVFTGYAVTADYHHVSTDLNRWVTRLGCTHDIENTPDMYYEVLNNGAPPVYIYNTVSKTAEYAEIRDVAIGTDMITIFSSNSTVRAVVIIR